jgi:hypothetical protein
MFSSPELLRWVLLVSNVIMAFLSIVNAVPGEPSGPIGHPYATPGTAPLRPSTRPLANQLNRPLTVAALVGAATLLRHRFLRWGATTQEQHRALAGDGVLPAADVSTTRAITINAQAADVWPWLAQLGQGRGGFYSYDWLENLIPGVDIHNADRIVPQWQHISVGAEVRLAPEVPLTVVVLEPGRALALRGSVPMGGVAPPYDFTWAFVLLPRADGTTRLVVRERYAYTRRWASLIVQPATLVSCLMTPKMLRGIKSRVERTMPNAVRPPCMPMSDRDATADPISAAR